MEIGQLDLTGALVIGCSTMAAVIGILWTAWVRQNRRFMAMAKEFIATTERSISALNKNTETIDRHTRTTVEESRETRDVLLKLFGDSHMPPKRRT